MDILIRRYKKLLTEVNTDIKRFIYNEIDWSQPLIGIKGQRGVGKTTLIYKIPQDGVISECRGEKKRLGA